MFVTLSLLFRFQSHVAALKKIPGAKVLFGGELLDPTSHNIPSCYGSFLPTAVQIPLQEFVKPDYYDLCCTEIFGPFQVVVEYGDDDLDLVLDALERTTAHLTAAIVSKDIVFQNKVSVA